VHFRCFWLLAATISVKWMTQSAPRSCISLLAACRRAKQSPGKLGDAISSQTLQEPNLMHFTSLQQVTSNTPVLLIPINLQSLYK